MTELPAGRPHALQLIWRQSRERTIKAVNAKELHEGCA
jgi:hypothetical protein